jgi:hypothetical protein
MHHDRRSDAASDSNFQIEIKRFAAAILCLERNNAFFNYDYTAAMEPFAASSALTRQFSARH